MITPTQKLPVCVLDAAPAADCGCSAPSTVDADPGWYFENPAAVAEIDYRYRAWAEKVDGTFYGLPLPTVRFSACERGIAQIDSAAEDSKGIGGGEHRRGIYAEPPTQVDLVATQRRVRRPPDEIDLTVKTLRAGIPADALIPAMSHIFTGAVISAASHRHSVRRLITGLS